jgi:hypothetical protein
MNWELIAAVGGIVVLLLAAARLGLGGS